MTRKIKYSCDGGGIHHALVALAITEAGLTKGFRDSDGFTRSVVLDEGSARGEAGSYSIQVLQGGEVFATTTTAAGCLTTWRFTWPDLKLTGYQLSSCSCTGYQRTH